jgi:hypothetical protein
MAKTGHELLRDFNAREYGYPEGGWLPDQKLTVEQAVYLFKMGPAYCNL